MRSICTSSFAAAALALLAASGAAQEAPLQPQIRPSAPAAAAKAGTVTSEGVAAMNADAWHAEGLTGEGVVVGIVDRGFLGAEGLCGSDLPEASKVVTSAFGAATLGDSDHGTACAEIVHDVAPALETMLLAAAATEADVVEALAWMQAQGAHVVAVSLPLLGSSPGDGSGVVADAIAAFAAAGGLVLVAAGDLRLVHWQGTWEDFDEDGWLEFATGWESNYVLKDDAQTFHQFPAGTALEVFLTWNQWSAPATDLKLTLFRWDGTSTEVPVAAADAPQTGAAGQLPVEIVSFTTLQAGLYGFGISLDSGTIDGLQAEVFFPVGGALLLEDYEAQGSLAHPADTAAALSVAALGAEDPYDLEATSSAGPANGPGGSFDGGVSKPDLAGHAGVSTATSATFAGTAAGSAHAAGAAALVWSANPDWTGAQVRDFLQSRAVDMDPTGIDTDTGWGRLWLGQPPGVDCDPPATPTGLAASDPEPAAGDTYTLSWEAAALADAYDVQEATDSAFTAPVTTQVTTTSADFSHVVSGDTNYYYRVRSVRECGEVSDWSDTVSVVVSPACPPPDTPTGLATSTDTAASGEPYTVSWESAELADSYEVEEALDSAFTVPVTTQVTTTSADFSHVVTADTSYYYRVRSVRNCGSASDWSTTVSVLVEGGECTAPATPESFRADPTTVSSGECFSLLWEESAGADRYRGEESDDPSFSVVIGFEETSTSTTLCRTVTEDTVFYYRLKAVADCGEESDWTASVTVTVAAEECTAPLVPAGMAAGAAVVGDGESFLLQWNAVEGAEYYELQEGWDPGFDAYTIARVTGTLVVRTLEGSSAGIHYYFRVRARRLCGSEAMSSDWSATVEVVVMTQPTGGGPLFVLPAAAHLPGANQTLWKTDLRIFNPTADAVSVNIAYLEEEHANLGSLPNLTFDIPALGTLVVDDVVPLFPYVGDGKGALRLRFTEIEGGLPVIASRTFNDTPNGTFGQFVPAVPLADTLPATLLFTGLTQNDDFRTNLGMVNLGTATATGIPVTVLDGTGATAGQLTAEILPMSSVQLGNVAVLAGATGDLEVFSVRVDASSFPLTGYASVVDNRTGDPALISPTVLGDDLVVVPGLAHAPGSNNSRWRSDVTIFNPSPDPLQVLVELVPEGGITPPSPSLAHLDPGAAIMARDIIALLLPGLDAKGYLVLSGYEQTPAPLVAARTYNLADTGTFGQSILAFGPATWIAAGERASITGLSNSATTSAGFRSNLGLVNLDDAEPAEVEVVILAVDGAIAGEALDLTLAPRESYLDNVFYEADLASIPLEASLQIHLVSGGPLLAYASVVDNRTQDPVFIPAQILQ